MIAFCNMMTTARPLTDTTVGDIDQFYTTHGYLLCELACELRDGENSGAITTRFAIIVLYNMNSQI